MVALYLATWVGGTLSHWLTLRAETQSAYETLVARFSELPPERKRHPLVMSIPGGPIARVYFSAPVLPGLLVVLDQRFYGGLSLCGSLKLVGFYGVGSVVVSEMVLEQY